MAFKRYLALLGVILFIFVLSQINLSAVFSIWAKAQFIYFAIALLCVACIVLLRAKKWHILVQTYSSHYSILDCLRYWCIGFFLSLLTPGRVGDLSRAFYLKDKLSLPTGILSVAVDRLMDIVLLLLWSTASVFLFGWMFHQDIVSFPVLALLFLGLFACAWFFSKADHIKFLLRPFFNLFVPENLKSKVKLSFSEFYDSIALLKKNPGRLLRAFLYGFVSWILVMAVGYFLMLALNIELPFMFLFVLMPFLSLVDLIPVSISGLGTREVTAIFLFSLFNLSSEIAVAFSLTYLLLSFVSVALLGLVFFIRQPISLNWPQN